MGEDGPNGTTPQLGHAGHLAVFKFLGYPFPLLAMDHAPLIASIATDLVFADLGDSSVVADLIGRLSGITGPAEEAAAEAIGLLVQAPGADAEDLRVHISAALDRAQTMSAGLAPAADLNADPARLEFLGRAPDALADLASLVDQLEGDPAVIPDLRRAIHTLKGEAGALDLRAIALVLHAAEDALLAPAASQALAEPVRQALDWVAHRLEDERAGTITGEGPDEIIAAIQAATPSPAPLGEVLVGTGRVAKADVEAALAAQSLTPERKLGEILVDAGKIAPDDLADALQTQQPSSPRPMAPVSSVRVDASRVDALYDAVGELVIAQSMVAGSPEVRRLASRQVRALLAQVERTTRAIQDLAFRLRLVPVKALLQRTARVARETARTVGRDIEVVLVGEDQELDRAVVDRLGEPLLHLVRNAVDHGLETPDEREAAGKPRSGRITLAAVAHGGTFRIEVGDDGRGLDRDRILNKAREQGLIDGDGSEMSDEDVWHLIFRAGFSTAATLTNVSGRGVGLDAVRTAVDGLRGQVRIETIPGKGTSFAIQLPPTLAIIDGLAVHAGGRDYILPTLSVVATARLDQAEVTTVAGRGRLLSFHGRQLTLVDMADLFQHTPSEPPRRPLVVVVEDGRRRCAIAVDAVLGRQQIVLKDMGAGLPPVDGIGGATIAADGRPTLVVDVSAVITLALGAEIAARRAS